MAKKKKKRNPLLTWLADSTHRVTSPIANKLSALGRDINADVNRIMRGQRVGIWKGPAKPSRGKTRSSDADTFISSARPPIEQRQLRRATPTKREIAAR